MHARDRVRDVVAAYGGQFRLARTQVDQLAVQQPYLSRGRRGLERGLAEALQHPAAGGLGHRGPVQAGVPRDHREKVGERHLRRERDVDPAARPDHGNPADVHGQHRVPVDHLPDLRHMRRRRDHGSAS
jgi:hypothetical protein